MLPAVSGLCILVYRDAGEVYQLGNALLGPLACGCRLRRGADPAFLGELDVERHGAVVERGWWTSMRVLNQGSEQKEMMDDGRWVSQTLLFDSD